MPGQATTGRRLWLYAVTALSAVTALTILTLPAVGGASGPRGSGALRAQERSLARRSRAAVLDLYALDRRLTLAETRLARLQRSEASLRAERASLGRELVVARRGTAIAQAQLARRLRLLYEQRSVGPIEVLLGSRTLDDAMTNFDDLSAAAAANKRVLHELEAAKTRVATVRRALDARAAALARARAEASANAAAIANARTARLHYVASLADARRLTAGRIAKIVAAAHAAEARTERLQPGVPAAADSTLSGLRLTVATTGYSLGGRTSSGLPVGVGVAAVDPSVIPLGTHMSIPGYGEAVAADTGSSIRGNRVDLWFPTRAKAREWGRRTVTITLR